MAGLSDALRTRGGSGRCRGVDPWVAALYARSSAGLETLQTDEATGMVLRWHLDSVWPLRRGVIRPTFEQLFFLCG